MKTAKTPPASIHRMTVKLPADVARMIRRRAADLTAPGARVTPSDVISGCVRKAVPSST
jgi:hypothetical protein